MIYINNSKVNGTFNHLFLESDIKSSKFANFIISANKKMKYARKLKSNLNWDSKNSVKPSVKIRSASCSPQFSP